MAVRGHDIKHLLPLPLHAIKRCLTKSMVDRNPRGALLRSLPVSWLRGPAWRDGEWIVFDCTQAEPYDPAGTPKVGIYLAGVRTPDEAVRFVQTYGLFRPGDEIDEKHDDSSEEDDARPAHPPDAHPVYVSFVGECCGGGRFLLGPAGWNAL